MDSKRFHGKITLKPNVRICRVNDWGRALFAAALVYLGCGVSTAETNGISITNGEWAPFMSQHVPHYGFASHVTEEAFALVDMSVKWEFMPWRRAYSLAAHGDWDASIGWLKTDEREKQFLFTAPILHETRVLFQRDDNRFEWKTINDLKGIRLGISHAADYPILRPVIDSGKVATVRFPNYLAALRALLKGRVDAVAGPLTVGNHLLRNNFKPAERGRVRIAEKVIETLPFHLIVSRNIENGPVLVKKFNEGLDKLQASGRYAHMLSLLHEGGYD